MKTKKLIIEIYESHRTTDYFFNWRAKINGRIVASGKGYNRRRDAKRAVYRLATYIVYGRWFIKHL